MKSFSGQGTLRSSSWISIEKKSSRGEAEGLRVICLWRRRRAVRVCAIVSAIPPRTCAVSWLVCWLCGKGCRGSVFTAFVIIVVKTGRLA